MSVSVEFSRAKAEHLPAILELEQAAFALTEQWSENSWRAEIAGSLVLVIGDPVQGVAAFRVVDELAELFRIIVAEDARNQGLGRQLLAEGIRWAGTQQAERLLLEVRADNSPAIALYQAAGFEPIQVRRDYYGSGADAVVMELTLKEEA